ncbi:RNA polymerase subunit sigma-24 [Clostridia bacterium]|nr:RNA polymerase subunit sigma-24 [Clostridia bacterium]
MAEKKYLLRVDGKLISVSYEVYQAYYRASRHERFLREQDEAHGVMLLDNYDIAATTNIEDEVIRLMLREKVRRAVARLSPPERELIYALFYNGMTEREYAKYLGISQQGVGRRKKKVLENLKKLF